MFLIADAGATKIQWVVVHENVASEPMETAGFNPYFMGSDILVDILEKDLVPFIKVEAIRQVFFYGAGCSTVQKCGVVDDAINSVFDRVDCEVYHDLLGAARALFLHDKGIACILGTGSNSCLYDGRDILENVPSLAYLFGDEGGGAYLGKLFLTDYLKKRLPADLSATFDQHYHYSLENILDSVYNKPHPNRFLASFATFLGDHMEEDYVRELLRRNFEDFLNEQVMKYTGYKEVPLGIVGSVGFHFREILRQVVSAYGLEIKTILKNPIEGLVKFHLA
jgi:glucosamine kinase